MGRLWIGRIFLLGVKNLLLHKLRSILTALGILFGVASVIAMLAIGEGASYEAQEMIRAMGSTNLIIESRKPPDSAEETGDGDETERAVVYGLTYDDARAIEEIVPAVRRVVPVREIPLKARYGARRKNVDVQGTHSDYAKVTGLTLEEGRWLAPLDDELRRNVVVLGSAVARHLFPFSSPLEEQVWLGRHVFRCVGVLASPETTTQGSESNLARDAVFIPLGAARAWYGAITAKTGKGSMEFEKVDLHRAIVQVETNEDVPSSAAILRHLLDQRHEDEDVKVTVPLELLRQSEATQRIFRIVLGSIAAISLLVGGIGIMNVMLATVTERTREIGVRRALGARRYHILAQFLVETLVIALLGGLLGVALGLAIPALVTRFSDLPTVISIEFPIIAFLVSAIVGVAFGIYPAWRAANMDPVEALRHE